MPKVKLLIKINNKSFDKTFYAKPNEDTNAGAIQEAAVYFYGVEHEFLANRKPDDILLISVFDSLGRIIINGFYSPKGDQVIDLRKNRRK